MGVLNAVAHFYIGLIDRVYLIDFFITSGYILGSKRRMIWKQN